MQVNKQTSSNCNFMKDLIDVIFAFIVYSTNFSSADGTFSSLHRGAPAGFPQITLHGIHTFLLQRQQK